MACIFVGGTASADTAIEVETVYGGMIGILEYQRAIRDKGPFNIPNKYYVSLWGEGLGSENRIEGEWELMGMIIEHCATRPGEKLGIFGFSHGANIAIRALNWALARIEDPPEIWLITLACPSLADYSDSADKLGARIPDHWINIYNDYDPVQGKWAGIAEFGTDNPRSYDSGSLNCPIRTDYRSTRIHSHLARSQYAVKAVELCYKRLF